MMGEDVGVVSQSISQPGLNAGMKGGRNSWDGKAGKNGEERRLPVHHVTKVI